MDNCTQISQHIHLSPYDFYKQYHTHPINKFFHLFGIPCILLSTLLFLKHFHIVYDKPLFGFRRAELGIGLNNILVNFYTIYYFTYGFYPGFIMFLYFTILNWSTYWLYTNKKITYGQTFQLFILSWIFQFLGHFIEGKKPALMDSVGQAFLGAPIFSLTPIIPSLNAYF